MNERLKYVARILTVGIIWVFVLSIRWDGRPIFYTANDLLVQNPLVRSIDSGLNDGWHRLQRAVHVAFAKNARDEATSL